MRMTLVVLSLAAGCYRSYEFEPDASAPPPDAVVDVGNDVAPDAGVECIPVEVRPFGSYGSEALSRFAGLRTSDRDAVLWEILRAREIEDGGRLTGHLIEGCLPSERQPWALTLTMSGTIASASLYGISEAIQTDMYGYPGNGIQVPGTLPNIAFDVRPRDEGNRFWVQHGVFEPVLVDGDYEGYCMRRNEACPYRFVEVDTDGRLVGGGGRNIGWREVDIGVASSDAVLVEASAEIVFDAGGAAPRFSTVTVQAYDCSGQQFSYRPTQVDRWRCGIASAPVEVEVAWTEAGGVARVSLPVLAEAEGLRADTLIVRGAFENWEVLAAEPWSMDAAEVRFEVPAIESVEASGTILGSARWRVEATQYERGYAALTALDAIRGPDSLHVPVQPGPVFEVDRVAPGYLATREDAETYPLRALYVGAMTVREGEPWRDHVPKVAIARAVIPFAGEPPSPVVRP